ncbi:hypothetical protein JTE90_010807 [Oedothorax gibbosus]|uniref:C2H2-type domain-containing protein n=1 Tax=Oedothorax gibbosus TaxID=931172 RepID=A0AAV6VFR8_9ARAC|nr:hypothetical protein JTE90_010807 [Oedothorax gibbosus]
MSKGSTSKRSVLDERFLKCGECNERFWDNSKLVEHMESHAETKHLLCTICNKTFSVVQDLDKHYLLHRVLMQPFGCPACEARFATQDHLVKHVENIHPELTIGDQGKNPPQEAKTKRKPLPRSTKNQIKIESVQSVSSPVRSPSPRKAKSPNEKVVQSRRSPVKSPAQKGKLPNSKKVATKKSILKVVPTPSGKKRPVVWKDPVVSPEQNANRNVISVQYKQSPGEKRRLVSASTDSSASKKLKLVSPGPSGTLKLPVTTTPVKHTPITKTKLMQNISNLYDNPAHEEKKSMAQTRKDLLNSLTITPVTKGPIRVTKTAKPFIIYCPSNEIKTVQLNNSTNVSNSNVGSPKSTSGSITFGKLTESKSTPDNTQAFDKLFVSKTSISQSNTGTPEIKRLSFETKNPISPSKISTIQLIPITQNSLKPELSIQATPTVNPSTNSMKLIKNVTVVSPTGNAKLLHPIFPACKFSPDLKIIPQMVQSSPVKNVPSTSSPNTITATLPRQLKSPVTSTKVAAPLISEEEVLRDPLLKSQKLQILLPSIKLRKITEDEFLKATSKGLAGANNNNIAEVSNPDSLLPRKGVKRRGKQQSQDGETISKHAKRDSRVQTAETKANISNTKAQNKVPSAKGSIQKQANLKKTPAIVGMKTRRKLQSVEVTSTTDDKPVVSKAAGKDSPQIVQSSPQSTTRNVAKKAAKRSKDVSRETQQFIASIRKSTSPGTQAVKEEVIDSEAQKITAPSTRRSKRTVARSVSPQKRSVSKKKAVVKDIPKKVIEEVDSTNVTEKKDETNTIQDRSVSPRNRNISKKTPVVKDLPQKVTEEVNSTDVAEKKEEIQENHVQSSPEHNKIRVVTLTPEVMNKLKATVLKKTTSSTPNHIRLVVPSEVLSRIQNATLKKETEGSAPSTSALQKPDEARPLSNLKVSVVPKNIVRYGVEDLKRIKQKEQEENEKEEILKVKFEEKERRKQIKFCEKKLTRFLDRHPEKHLEKVKERLLTVRSLTVEEGSQLLMEVVANGCKTCKEVVGRTLCTLGFGDERDLFQDKAVEGLVALSTSKAKGKIVSKKASPAKKVSAAAKARKVKASESFENKKVTWNEGQKKAVSVPSKKNEPSRTSFSVIECAINKGDLSYSKKTDSKDLKPTAQMKNPVKIPRKRIQRKSPKQPFANDPFVDVSIINTEEKFVIECPCMKPNCNGLHPENFFI